MKSAVCAIVLALVMVSTAGAQSPAKVTLDARDIPIKEVVSDLARQSGADIVLDPKVEGKVTASVKDADLGQALNTITSVNKLAWKKIQFARTTDSKVTIDQLQSAVLALASLPLVGFSVEDPASKTSAVFARDMPASPDTSGLKLPEGYAWTTVYVVMPSEIAATAAADTDKDAVKSLSDTSAKIVRELVSLAPEQRQQVLANQMIAELNMLPDQRRALLKDRMSAMFNMDQGYREQFHEDMRSIWGEIRREREQQGLSAPDGGHRHR